MIVEIVILLPVAVRVEVRAGEGDPMIASVVSTECNPTLHDVRRAIDDDALAAIEAACAEPTP